MTEPISRRRWARPLLSAAVALVLIVGVLPRLADFSAVWTALARLEGGEIAALGLIATWNLTSSVLPMLAALPGLRIGHAFVASQLATAVTNTVPGGSALGVGITYAVFSSFGHTGTAIGLAAVVTGLWNTMVVFGLPAVALLILAAQGVTSPALLSAAGFGALLLVGALATLVLVLAADRLAHRAGEVAGRIATAVGGWFRRGPYRGWGDRFSAFRRDSIDLLRRRWVGLTAGTVVSHLSMYAVLLASLRFLGIDGSAVTNAEALGAFAVVRLATAVPITPGGLGIVEVGLTAALVVAGGSREPVVAAVLLYRGLTFLVQVPLGAAAYAVWAKVMRTQA